MKYSVEVETDSQVYETGYGSPGSSSGRGSPSNRHLLWAIEVEFLEDRFGDVGDDNVDILTTPTPIRRISRMEKQEELIQKALRKKSRKVSKFVILKYFLL